MLEIKHDIECPAFRKDECFCDCGATEKALRARVAELETERALMAQFLHHSFDCDWHLQLLAWDPDDPDVDLCTCGLTAALNPKN